MADIRLGLYEKSMPDNISWQQKFGIVKSSGFDCLEISIDESEGRLSRLDFDDEQFYLILKESRKAKVEIDSICLSAHRKYPLGSQDAETRTKSVDILHKTLEFADYIGARIIQLAGYDVYYEDSTEETKKYFTDNLFRITDMASSYGIILALETMENSFMDSVTKAMDHVRMIDSPYLKIYPDIGNISNHVLALMSIESQNLKTDYDLPGHIRLINDDLVAGKGHIVAVHLKETLPGIYRGLRFGEGIVPFKELISKLCKSGIFKYTAEFWYKEDQDYVREINEANMFFRDIFERI